ncbi:MAG: FMN-binding negative transcriptional regulator [Actinomycetota bacterium]
MLIHRHDDATDDEGRWRAFVVAQGFGHLVAAGRDRSVPVVVPTQFLLDDDRVLLHLAKVNPMLDAIAENSTVVLSVAGDWAYIPGSWKQIADEDPRFGIPTTYYGAVQLTGEASVLDGPEAIAATLGAQVSDLEPDGDYVDPLEHGARLRTIRAVEIALTDVRAKFKYGGNVDQAHRDAVAEHLAQREGPGDAAALSHMRRS